MNKLTWKAHGKPEQFVYWGRGKEPGDIGVEVTVTMAGGVLRMYRVDDGRRWTRWGPP